MRPIDALFIILIFSSCLKNSKQKYFVSILPILVFAVSLFSAHIPASFESFVLPLIAIIACVICIELAPLSLLLILTEYNHLWEVLLIPLLWFSINPIMENLHARINDEYIPTYIRGFPIRIISLGILYYVFYPLFLI